MTRLPLALAALAAFLPSPAPAQQAAVALNRVRTELVALGTAQTNYYTRRATYAPSLAELSSQGLLTQGGDVTLALLTAGKEAWSAVASDGTDPDVRCVAIGTPNTPNPQISCQASSAGPAEAAPAAPPPAADSAGRSLNRPPAVLECRDPEPQQGLVEGFVLLSFVVSAEGFVEPAGLRVLQSPTLQNAVWAIAAVANCRYQPALANGQPAPATVTRRVRYQKTTTPEAPR